MFLVTHFVTIVATVVLVSVSVATDPHGRDKIKSGITYDLFRQSSTRVCPRKILARVVSCLCNAIFTKRITVRNQEFVALDCLAFYRQKEAKILKLKSSCDRFENAMGALIGQKLQSKTNKVFRKCLKPAPVLLILTAEA